MPKHNMPEISVHLMVYDTHLVKLIHEIKGAYKDEEKIIQCLKNFWEDPSCVTMRSPKIKDRDIKKSVLKARFSFYRPRSIVLKENEDWVNSLAPNSEERRQAARYAEALENGDIDWEIDWDVFQAIHVRQASSDKDVLEALKECVIEWINSGEPLPKPIRDVTTKLIAGNFNHNGKRGGIPRYPYYYTRLQLAVALVAVTEGAKMTEYRAVKLLEAATKVPGVKEKVREFKKEVRRNYAQLEAQNGQP